MHRNKVSLEDEAEMIDLCVGATHANKNTKSHEKVVKLFLKQLVESEKLSRNQGANITIKIYSNPSDKSGNEASQMFIISCLLYLFVKYRSLKVAFEPSVKSSAKAADNEKYIWLNKKKNLHFTLPEFYKKFMTFLEVKNNELKQTQHFFDQLYFQMKLQSHLQNRKQINNIKGETFLFISEFYSQLNHIFVNSKIYLMKNTVICFKKDQDENNSKINSQENQCFKCLLSHMKNLYILSSNFANIQIEILSFLSKNEIQTSNQIQKQHKMVSQQQIDKGIFKQFNGTQLQYLETLSFTIKGQIQQISAIRKIIQSTPNLSFLFIKRNYNPQKFLDNINQLVETIIKYCPLIKRFRFQNIIVQNIQPQLLKRLYQGCPFLIDFQIGITFTYSIAQTYSNNHPQDRILKEKERQTQIILQALRLRNLTLHNNILTVKLLLKKDYNFLSALQIIDCIEPVVL